MQEASERTGIDVPVIEKALEHCWKEVDNAMHDGYNEIKIRRIGKFVRRDNGKES